MSFGYSVSDVALLTRLAWTTVKNSRKACGEYDELTQEVSGLHLVLRKLEKEVRDEEEKGKIKDSAKKEEGIYDDELRVILGGCEKVLGTLNKILVKYNGLSEQERAGKVRRLWQKVRFGNGEVVNLRDLRSKATHYASLMTLLLNMRSSGSIGRVEQQMNDAGGQLKEIKTIVNSIAALQMSQEGHEGSILSTYTNDDRSAWKDLRRELRHKYGFRDSDLRKNKAVIIGYITELGNRGVLDDMDPQENDEQWHDFHPVNDADTTVQADSIMSKGSDGLPAIEFEQFLDASVGVTSQTDSALMAQTPTKLDRKLAPADPEVTIPLSFDCGLSRATPVTLDDPENGLTKPHHAYVKTTSDSDSDFETQNREPSSGSCDIQGHHSETGSPTSTATVHASMSQKQSAQSSDQIRGSGKSTDKTEGIDEYEATSTTTERLPADLMTKDKNAASNSPNPIPEISHSAGAMPKSKARIEMMSIQTDNGNANPKRVDAGIVEDDDDDDDPEYQRYRRKSASEQASEACGHLGNKYYEQQRFPDAIEQCSLGIALEHKSLICRMNRAAAYMATGQIEKASHDLDIVVLDIDPSNHKAMEMRVRAESGYSSLTELHVKDYMARSRAALDPEPSRPVKSPRSTAARSKGPGAELEKLRLKLERDLNEKCELFIRSTPLSINTARIEYLELTANIAVLIFALEEVEVKGDERFRKERKDLIEKAQGLLTQLGVALDDGAQRYLTTKLPRRSTVRTSPPPPRSSKKDRRMPYIVEGPSARKPNLPKSQSAKRLPDVPVHSRIRFPLQNRLAHGRFPKLL